MSGLSLIPKISKVISGSGVGGVPCVGGCSESAGGTAGVGSLLLCVGSCGLLSVGAVSVGDFPAGDLSAGCSMIGPGWYRPFAVFEVLGFVVVWPVTVPEDVLPAGFWAGGVSDVFDF